MEIDNISFYEHDYSGSEFDIEAFVYYTYVSVIDRSRARVLLMYHLSVSLRRAYMRLTQPMQKFSHLSHYCFKNARKKTE